MAESLLSIPPEIRSMIFQYLLGDRATKSKQGLKRVYHAGILAVNKQLHAEAKGYLYKNNQFVLVEYAWKGFGYAPHQYRIPVIAQNRGQLDIPEYLTVRTKLDSYGQDWVDYPTEICGLTGWSDNQMGSFLILLKDLPHLISAIAWRMDTLPLPRVYVDHVANHDFDFVKHFEGGHKAVDVRIELLACPFRPNDFEELQRVIGTGSVIKSIDGLRLVRNDKKSCVWATGRRQTYPIIIQQKLWDNIVTAYSMKVAADRLSSRGRIKEARRLYSLIVAHDLYQSKIDPITHQYVERLGIILSDAALSGAYLALRQLDGYDARRLVRERSRLTKAVFQEETYGSHVDHFPNDREWNHDLPVYQHIIFLVMIFLCAYGRETLEEGLEFDLETTEAKHARTAELLERDIELVKGYVKGTSVR